MPHGGESGGSGVKHVRQTKLQKSVSYEEGVGDKVQKMERSQALYGFISQSKSLIVGIIGAMEDLSRRMIWYDLLKRLLCCVENGMGEGLESKVEALGFQVRHDSGSDYGSNKGDGKN